MYVIVQITSSEQVLGVEIAHFENMYNAEIRSGNYCCCDAPDSSCVMTLETLQICPNACKPFEFFSVHFQHCPSCNDCIALTKAINFSFDPTSEKISPFIFQIPLKQSDMELYNQVRIGMSYIISNCVTTEI